MSSSSELSAAQLATQLVTGHLNELDDSFMSTLVNRHHQLVFQICMKFLGHRQDAEDVTQETFSRFARHIDRWDRQRPLEPWLAKIAGNRCRSFLASRRRAHHQSLSDIGEPIRQEALQIDAANQLQEELAMAIKTLPKMQQTTFKMFHEQGLSYAEISLRVDRPLGTVKTWVHRARQQLIQRLSHREVIAPQNGSAGDLS